MKTVEYKIKKEKGTAIFESIKVESSKDAEKFARNFYNDDIGIYESMFLMLLNRANKITGWVKISQGGVTGTVCDPIIIAKYAIESLAKGVILVHNHPSGNLIPSTADKNINQKVKAGLSLFDITLVDSLIMTEESYYSFQDDCNL
jgi:DNA repair protein RadC